MSSIAGEDILRKINGLLSYHFHIPYPEKLNDEEYSEKWQQLKWVLGFEARRFSGEAGSVAM